MWPIAAEVGGRCADQDDARPPAGHQLRLAGPGRDGRIALEASGRDWAPKNFAVTFEINGEVVDGRATTLTAIRAAMPVGAKATVGWRVIQRRDGGGAAHACH